MDVTRSDQEPADGRIGGFSLIEEIGSGGMGVVYRARDYALKRDVALKLLNGDWDQSPSVLQRFLRESQILASISHPHVVQVFTVGQHRGAPFFVMELLEHSVAEVVKLKKPAINDVTRWMLEAASGLAAIHEKGVIHRDIKPGNLLLTRATSVDRAHVKVADLGIARVSDAWAEPLTRAGFVLGTSGYLAPESFKAGHKLDTRADQFALGVVFYELLAGCSPHNDFSDTALIKAAIEPRKFSDVRQHASAVDNATAAIVHRMLQDDPNARFTSTVELVAALHHIQKSKTIISFDSQAKQNSPANRSAISAEVAMGKLTKLSYVWIAIALVFTSFFVYEYFKDQDRTTVPGAVAGSQPSIPVSTDPSNGKQNQAAATDEETNDQIIATKALAKDELLGRYQLDSPGSGQTKWQFDIIGEKSGRYAARLIGAHEDKVLPMTGKITKHQTVRDDDGKAWQQVDMLFMDDQTRGIDIHMEFDDDYINGNGFFIEGEHTRYFEILSADDVPEE